VERERERGREREGRRRRWVVKEEGKGATAAIVWIGGGRKRGVEGREEKAGAGVAAWLKGEEEEEKEEEEEGGGMGERRAMTRGGGGGT